MIKLHHLNIGPNFIKMFTIKCIYAYYFKCGHAIFRLYMFINPMKYIWRKVKLDFTHF